MSDIRLQLNARCLVLDDNFASGIDSTTWSHEVQMNGQYVP